MIRAMPLPLVRVLAVGFLCASSAASVAQLTLRDDIGRVIPVKKPAARIVTFAPFLTELVYAAGAGHRVVGVGTHSEYPPEAKKLPEVQMGANFSLDVVAQLKPDLVLAWAGGLKREDIDRMTGFGATVFVAHARTLEDVPRLLKVIGQLSGNDVTMQVSEYEGKLDALRRANADKPKVAAFIEIWNRPLTTISGTHFLSEALEICHGENVFKDLRGVAPKVSWEEVFERNPFVILSAGSAGSEEEFRANWTIRQSIRAVKENRLLYLDTEAMEHPTTRTPDGIAQLCGALDRMRPPAPAVVQRPAGRASQYGM